MTFLAEEDFRAKLEPMNECPLSGGRLMVNQSASGRWSRQAAKYSPAGCTYRVYATTKSTGELHADQRPLAFSERIHTR